MVRVSPGSLAGSVGNLRDAVQDRAGSPLHLDWGSQALWERLNPLLPGLTVEVQARLGSTNTTLLERARQSSGPAEVPITRRGEEVAPSHRPRPQGRRAGDLAPCLLVAEAQSQGRGRLGREWVGQPGASLTFSLGLVLAPARWAGLSLAVGLALAEALDPAGATAEPAVWLKWPNDLWLAQAPGQGRKLGGILIETVSVGSHRFCVVGVGLNVAPLPAVGLEHGLACVQERDPAATPPSVLAAVALPLVQALQRFEAEGFAPLRPRFQRRDLLLGQPVTTTAPGGCSGMAVGVDDHGALAVDDGRQVHHVHSGEVSVRLASSVRPQTPSPG